MPKLRSWLGGGQAAKKAAERESALREVVGEELSAKLIDHLGLEEAAALVEGTVAEARDRWARFGADLDSLTEEEHEEMTRTCKANTIKERAVEIQVFMAQRVLNEAETQEMRQKADESGMEDPEDRIKFIYRFVAEKIAGDVASKAIKRAKLPGDHDLRLDLGARIFLTLIPMRIG